VLSIIIPTYNEQEFIGSLLNSILADFDDGVEVIVVDGGSQDNTLNIVKEFTNVRALVSVKGRSNQMNEGAKISNGEILFFVHADSHLPLVWKTQILKAMTDPACLAGTFYLKFDQPGFWYDLYSRMSHLKSSLFTYGDQGLFVRKTAFDRSGGFQNIPIMEDYEMLRGLKRIGRLVKLDTAITTSSRKFVKNGVIFQQLKNITIVILYLLGVSPEFLSKWYYQ
jgi:rSAM/selenodomain-associated transferase 2